MTKDELERLALLEAYEREKLLAYGEVSDLRDLRRKQVKEKLNEQSQAH